MEMEVKFQLDGVQLAKMFHNIESMCAEWGIQVKDVVLGVRVIPSKSHRGHKTVDYIYEIVEKRTGRNIGSFFSV
jgi:hypothetical protein